jgi:hypothetical protein
VLLADDPKLPVDATLTELAVLAVLSCRGLTRMSGVQPGTPRAHQDGPVLVVVRGISDDRGCGLGVLRGVMVRRPKSDRAQEAVVLFARRNGVVGVGWRDVIV